jgi:hypothetical protein
MTKFNKTRTYSSTIWSVPVILRQDRLPAYDPGFAEHAEVAERVMREDQDALKKLAE